MEIYSAQPIAKRDRRSTLVNRLRPVRHSHGWRTATREMNESRYHFSTKELLLLPIFAIAAFNVNAALNYLLYAITNRFHATQRTMAHCLAIRMGMSTLAPAFPSLRSRIPNCVSPVI